VLLFLLTELIARALYFPENLGRVFRFDRDLGWSLEPNSSLRSVDYFSGLDWRIDINSLGLRERDVQLEKPKGKKRVLILGDSVVFGTGVDASHRFSDFLNRALDPDYEVINGGVAGWGTDQELIYYELRGCNLKPDVVVLTLTIANDVLNNMIDHLFLKTSPKPRFTMDGDSLTLVRMNYEGPKVQNPSLLRRLMRESRLLVFVKRRLDRMKYERMAMKTIDCVPPGFTRANLDKNYSNWSVYRKSCSPQFDEAWRVTEAILKRFSDLCRANGAHLIVFAFPLRIEVDADWRTGLLRRIHVDPSYLDMKKPYDRLATFCSEEGIHYIYPLHVFEDALKRKYLYIENDNHPNVYGHALAARVLLTEMQSRIPFNPHFVESDRPYFEVLQ
jgi:hypothetical protein